MRHLSYRSRLIEMAGGGKHYDVKVDPLSLRRLIAWVDAHCPYAGKEEIRRMATLNFRGSSSCPSARGSRPRRS
jgi:hypothetical protein